MGRIRASMKDGTAGALRDEAGGLGGKQAMSCKARDFFVGTLGKPWDG